MVVFFVDILDAGAVGHWDHGERDQGSRQNGEKDNMIP
jgi:hypothetical protein